MTNNLTMAKKAFSVAVAATTILWSVGLSAFLPTAASAAAFGDLIKGTTLSTVYYYGSDGQRYAFPNEKTFFSWYNDFSSVKTITDSELAAITLAGNIAYRAGSRWVKITSDAKVYVVSTKGKIRWVENEATAKGLGGDNWNTHIDDVPDVFFVDYTVGDSLTSAVAGYDGMLWTDGTSKYLVSGAKYSKVTDAGFSANSYKSSFVLSGTGFTKSGLTAGDDVTAAKSSLTDAAQKVTTDTYAATQNVSVAIAATSPASSTIIAGQGVANVLALTFTNPTSSVVSVKSVALKRIGVSADATLANVYLFNGGVRSTDSATVSSGVVSFNDAGGLFSIPAGGSSTINVRSDIAASTSGQTLGLQLVDASKVSFVGAFAVTGSFPISSALHTVASVSNFGTVSFAVASSSPAVNSSANPENDFKVWQSQVTVGVNDTWLHSIRFRNIGSINAADVKNWRLYVDGVLTSSAVASQDANGYVSFDVSSAPKKLKVGTRDFKVLADVVGGSTRTMTVSLRTAGDAVFFDDQYQQPVLVLAAGSAFAATNAGQQTIAAGDISIVKRADSLSGDIVNGATNAVLGRFDVKATGEAMKIESLNFNVIRGTETAVTLRNGVVYADGTQIGNTTSLCGSYTTTASACTGVAGSGNSYTQYNFGSSFIVYPGTPAILEVRADIYDNLATNGLAAAQTLQLAIDAGAASSNVLRKVSGDYISRPASDVNGNQFTIREGALVLLKNNSYASQSVVAPKVAYKVGAFTVTSSTAEPVNITNLALGFNTATNVSAADATNLYIMYGTAGNMKTSTVKTAPTLTTAANSYSVDYTLQPNTTMYVEAYLDLNSTMGGNEVIITDLTVTATGKNSGASASATVQVGQTITATTGSFAATLDGSSPVAALFAGNQTVAAAKYRFSATADDYTIDKISFSIPAAAIGVPATIQLFDGTSPVGTEVFDETASSAGDKATFNDVNVLVKAGTYKTLTVKLALNSVGTGAASSQLNSAVTITSVFYKDSQGVTQGEVTSFTTAAGNEINVMKGVPVVNVVDLTNSTLVNGQAQDVYKFTIAASGGDVALKQLIFPITWSDGDINDTLSVGSWKLYKNGAEVTSSVSIVSTKTGVNAKSGGTALLETDLGVAISWTSEDVVALGETATYTLRATPTAFHVNNTSAAQNNDMFTLYLAGDGTAITYDSSVVTGTGDNSTKVYLNAFASTWTTIYKLHTAAAAAGASGTTYNFIWSDVSATGHTSAANASSTADWANGYLVLNLDLASETWSK